jgi:hypothetical protein
MARTTVATIVIIVIFGFELIILGHFYGLLLSVRDATASLGAGGAESSVNSTFFRPLARSLVIY